MGVLNRNLAKLEGLDNVVALRCLAYVPLLFGSNHDALSLCCLLDHNPVNPIIHDLVGPHVAYVYIEPSSHLLDIRKSFVLPPVF